MPPLSSNKWSPWLDWCRCRCSNSWVASQQVPGDLTISFVLFCFVFVLFCLVSHTRKIRRRRSVDYYVSGSDFDHGDFSCRYRSRLQSLDLQSRQSWIPASHMHLLLMVWTIVRYDDGCCLLWWMIGLLIWVFPTMMPGFPIDFLPVVVSIPFRDPLCILLSLTRLKWYGWKTRWNSDNWNFFGRIFNFGSCFTEKWLF